MLHFYSYAGCNYADCSIAECHGKYDLTYSKSMNLVEMLEIFALLLSVTDTTPPYGILNDTGKNFPLGLKNWCLCYKTFFLCHF